MCALTERPSRATCRSASYKPTCTSCIPFQPPLLRDSPGALETPGSLGTLPVPCLVELWSVASHFREGTAGVLLWSLEDPS